jgi:hypothetical protein
MPFQQLQVGPFVSVYICGNFFMDVVRSGPQKNE